MADQPEITKPADATEVSVSEFLQHWALHFVQVGKKMPVIKTECEIASAALRLLYYRACAPAANELERELVARMEQRLRERLQHHVAQLPVYHEGRGRPKPTIQ